MNFGTSQFWFVSPFILYVLSGAPPSPGTSFPLLPQPESATEFHVLPWCSPFPPVIGTSVSVGGSTCAAVSVSSTPSLECRSAQSPENTEALPPSWQELSSLPPALSVRTLFHLIGFGAIVF